VNPSEFLFGIRVPDPNEPGSKEKIITEPGKYKKTNKERTKRVPEDIDRAIKYVSNAEKIENTQSLRKLTRLGFELYVAKNYQSGDITLREASELLNLTMSETIDRLSKMGVTGNIRSSDVLASLNTVTPLD
jgi:predicted HTH domain antitoxin